MNSPIKSYINTNYKDYSLLPKTRGGSSGFILEKTSFNKEYFKSDEGYLPDYFVCSVFPHVSGKAPKSKIHYINGGKIELDSTMNPAHYWINPAHSDFFLSTHEMNKSYQKGGIFKLQTYTDFSQTKRQVCQTLLTQDQLDQFKISLAKLRLLAFIFALSDLRDENVGFLEKKEYVSESSSWVLKTVKVGIVDFHTPLVYGNCRHDNFELRRRTPLFERCSQTDLVQILNGEAECISLPGCQECEDSLELTLKEYQQASTCIRYPNVKELDVNGYWVSNSLGEKTGFRVVVEDVFNDIRKTCSAFESIDQTSFKQLSDYLCKIEEYKNVTLSRFERVVQILDN